ncbi:2-oxoglutarate (2OG) and Fe(II)-dependent oxygenase superfamily protein [Euphorbia peplus]|nr:2-oxoglutarate (2OG) and Fe(II)-dependent oxygenase superfamily protein [Euphorbia peplus]
MEERKQFDKSKIGVKGSLDSGIASIPEIPARSPAILHPCTGIPARSPAKLISNTSHHSDHRYILIDSDQTHRAKIIHQVKEAATKWSFFQVINHGISDSILQSTL